MAIKKSQTGKLKAADELYLRFAQAYIDSKLNADWPEAAKSTIPTVWIRIEDIEAFCGSELSESVLNRISQIYKKAKWKFDLIDNPNNAYLRFR